MVPVVTRFRAIFYSVNSNNNLRLSIFFFFIKFQIIARRQTKTLNISRLLQHFSVEIEIDAERQTKMSKYI